MDAWSHELLIVEAESVSWASEPMIVRYDFHAEKDINGDGLVTPIDLFILEHTVHALSQGEGNIARKVLYASLSEVIWQEHEPNTDSPSEEGVITHDGGAAFRDSPPNGEPGDNPPCPPATLVSRGQYPHLVAINQRWASWDPSCAFRQLNYTVRVSPFYYGERSFQCPCQSNGIVLHWSLTGSNTYESHVSVEAGVDIDSIFNFGVTWGASATHQTTETVSWDNTCGGGNTIFFYAFLGYKVSRSVTYSYPAAFTSASNPCRSGTNWGTQAEGHEKDTIKTMSMRSFVEQWTCGICPQ